MSPQTLDSIFVVSVSHIIGGSRERETHSTPTWPMIRYFKDRCERLAVLELPLPRKGMALQPQAVFYSKGAFSGRKLMPKILCLPFKMSEKKIRPRTYFRLKVRDALAMAWFVLAFRMRFGLFIGVESLPAITGGVLKILGVAGKTVYYISDWAPVKFKNRLINRIYIKMDWFACRLSDFIWNYARTISEARRDILKYDMSKIGKEIWVPFGFIPDGVVHPGEKEIDKKSLVYCGGIGPEYGVELIIEALPLIRAKVPGVRIDILGDGPDIDRLKETAANLGVDGCITWHGYVSDRKSILSCYLKAAVSLAPFAPLEDSVKRYGDVIKIRESIGCGVPVVTTDVPPSHKEVLEKGLGEVIDYSAKSLADAVVRLLTDEAYYSSVRRNVLAASKDNLWENIYSRALQAMGYKCISSE